MQESCPSRRSPCNSTPSCQTLANMMCRLGSVLGHGCEQLCKQIRVLIALVRGGRSGRLHGSKAWSCKLALGCLTTPEILDTAGADMLCPRGKCCVARPATILCPAQLGTAGNSAQEKISGHFNEESRLRNIVLHLLPSAWLKSTLPASNQRCTDGLFPRAAE